MSITSGQIISYNDISLYKEQKWTLIGGSWTSSNWANDQYPFESTNLWNLYTSGIPLLFVWYYKPGTRGTARYFTSFGTWKGGMINDGYSNALIVSITLPFTDRNTSTTQFITKWYSIYSPDGAIDSSSSFIFSVSTTDGNYGTISAWGSSETLYPYKCYALTGDVIG